VDIHELIRNRRSIRKFKPDPVPPDVLTKIMDSAIWAPSAMNRQMWKFFILQDGMRDRLATLHQPIFAEMEPRLRDRYGDAGVELRRALYIDFANAPVAIAVFTEKGEHSDKMAMISAALACQNILLAASAEGLGSLVMGSSQIIQDEITFLCGMDPARSEFVMVILIGYADEIPDPPERRRKRVVYASSPQEIKH